jgi:hypothetical protein
MNSHKHHRKTESDKYRAEGQVHSMYAKQTFGGGGG